MTRKKLKGAGAAFKSKNKQGASFDRLPDEIQSNIVGRSMNTLDDIGKMRTVSKNFKNRIVPGALEPMTRDTRSGFPRGFGSRKGMNIMTPQMSRITKNTTNKDIQGQIAGAETFARTNPAMRPILGGMKHEPGFFAPVKRQTKDRSRRMIQTVRGTGKKSSNTDSMQF